MRIHTGRVTWFFALICLACVIGCDGAVDTDSASLSSQPPSAEMASENNPEPSPDGPADEPAANAYLDALTTRYVSHVDFDAWRCSSSVTDYPVAYIFPATAASRYAVIDSEQGFVAGFRVNTAAVQVPGGVTLYYPAADVTETLQHILFDGADQWTARSSTDGTLRCQRQQMLIELTDAS